MYSIDLETENVFVGERSGFFSSLNLVLMHLMKYYNESGGKFPKTVDTVRLLDWYRPRSYSGDFLKEFFVFAEDFSSPLLPPLPPPPLKPTQDDDPDEDQFSNFKKLKFENLLPFVKRYFVLSDQVQRRVEEIETKYGIKDYSKTAAVFYRGLSKHTEMTLGSYEAFYDETQTFFEKDENIENVIVQTDEVEFCEFFSKNRQELYFFGGVDGVVKSRNFIFFEEVQKLPNEKRHDYQIGNVEFALDKDSRFEHSLNFLAIVIILSKCKKIVMSSGNISYWMCLFRGHAEGIRQFYMGKEFV